MENFTPTLTINNNQENLETTMQNNFQTIFRNIANINLQLKIFSYQFYCYEQRWKELWISENPNVTIRRYNRYLEQKIEESRQQQVESLQTFDFFKYLRM